MRHILNAAQTNSLYAKGNLARALANDVAEAASRGWLTSRTGPTSFCNIWMLTPSGLTVLNIEKGIA